MEQVIVPLKVQVIAQAARKPTGRPPEPIVHGTVAGARKHYRRRDEMCDPCHEALCAYRREYERRRRAEAQVSKGEAA